MTWLLPKPPNSHKVIFLSPLLELPDCRLFCSAHTSCIAQQSFCPPSLQVNPRRDLQMSMSFPPYILCSEKSLIDKFQIGSLTYYQLAHYLISVCMEWEFFLILLLITLAELSCPKN